MEKITKFPCDKCGKEVWDIWNSCPKCGALLPAGKTRSNIHLPSLRRKD